MRVIVCQINTNKILMFIKYNFEKDPFYVFLIVVKKIVLKGLRSPQTFEMIYIKYGNKSLVENIMRCPFGVLVKD